MFFNLYNHRISNDQCMDVFLNRRQALLRHTLQHARLLSQFVLEVYMGRFDAFTDHGMYGAPN